MANENKDSEIKLRISFKEKLKIKSLADEANLSMSNFIRSVILSNKKLLILSKGSEIAKLLFLIHTDLYEYRDSGGLSKELYESLAESLNEVRSILYDLKKQLNNIHLECEEVNE